MRVHSCRKKNWHQAIEPLLLASIAIFGLASLFSAFTGSLGELSVLRSFTGLGIAGAFSGTTALTGDYTPQRLRATMIMVTFTGAPAGGFLLARGLPPKEIFLSACLFAIVAAVATGLLALRGPTPPLCRANPGGGANWSCALACSQSSTLVLARPRVRDEIARPI